MKRLVSYQDGWKGRNDLLYGKTYKEEEGAYFYPESYVGNMVIIRKQGMEIYDVNGLLDCLESESAILDGEIVAVSESEVIIKIYQGWYLLEKQQ